MPEQPDADQDHITSLHRDGVASLLRAGLTMLQNQAYGARSVDRTMRAHFYGPAGRLFPIILYTELWSPFSDIPAEEHQPFRVAVYCIDPFAELWLRYASTAEELTEALEEAVAFLRQPADALDLQAALTPQERWRI